MVRFYPCRAPAISAPEWALRTGEQEPIIVIKGKLLLYLNFLGICFGAFGAVIILRGVLITPEEAIEASGGYFGSFNKQQELVAPPVQNLLRQSKYALWGTVSLLVGFVCQGIAAWPFCGRA